MYNIHVQKMSVINVKYRTRAIITRGLYIFTPFFTTVFIVKRLVLQTIYVLNKEILQFFGQKCGVYDQVVSTQERVIMARVRYILSILL